VQHSEHASDQVVTQIDLGRDFIQNMRFSEEFTCLNDKMSEKTPNPL
jgi:hypothetical protein